MQIQERKWASICWRCAEQRSIPFVKKRGRMVLELPSRPSIHLKVGNDEVPCVEPEMSAGDDDVYLERMDEEDEYGKFVGEIGVLGEVQPLQESENDNIDTENVKLDVSGVMRRPLGGDEGIVRQLKFDIEDLREGLDQAQVDAELNADKCRKMELHIKQLTFDLNAERSISSKLANKLRLEMTELNSDERKHTDATINMLKDQLQNFEEQLDIEVKDRDTLQQHNHLMDQEIADLAVQLENERRHGIMFREQMQNVNIRAKALKQQLEEAHAEIVWLIANRVRLQSNEEVELKSEMDEGTHDQYVYDGDSDNESYLLNEKNMQLWRHVYEDDDDKWRDEQVVAIKGESEDEVIDNDSGGAHVNMVPPSLEHCTELKTSRGMSSNDPSGYLSPQRSDGALTSEEASPQEDGDEAGASRVSSALLEAPCWNDEGSSTPIVSAPGSGLLRDTLTQVSESEVHEEEPVTTVVEEEKIAEDSVSIFIDEEDDTYISVSEQVAEENSAFAGDENSPCRGGQIVEDSRSMLSQPMSMSDIGGYKPSEQVREESRERTPLKSRVVECYPIKKLYDCRYQSPLSGPEYFIRLLGKSPQGKSWSKQWVAESDLAVETQLEGRKQFAKTHKKYKMEVTPRRIFRIEKEAGGGEQLSRENYSSRGVVHGESCTPTSRRTITEVVPELAGNVQRVAPTHKYGLRSVGAPRYGMLPTRDHDGSTEQSHPEQSKMMDDEEDTDDNEIGGIEYENERDDWLWDWNWE